MGAGSSKANVLPSFYNYSIPETNQSWSYNCVRDGGGKTKDTVPVVDLIAMHKSFNDKLDQYAMAVAPNWCSVIARSDRENSGTEAYLSICAESDANQYEAVSVKTYQNNTGKFAQTCGYLETDWIAGSFALSPTVNLETGQPEQGKLFLRVHRQTEEAKKAPESPNQPVAPPIPDKPATEAGDATSEDPATATPAQPPPDTVDSDTGDTKPGNATSGNAPANTPAQPPPASQDSQPAQDAPTFKGDNWQQGQPKPNFTNGPNGKRDLSGRRAGKLATPMQKRDTGGGKFARRFAG